MRSVYIKKREDSITKKITYKIDKSFRSFHNALHSFSGSSWCSQQYLHHIIQEVNLGHKVEILVITSTIYSSLSFFMFVPSEFKFLIVFGST